MTPKAVTGAAVVWGTAKRAGAGHGSGIVAARRTEHELRLLRRAAPVQVDASSKAEALRLHHDGFARPATGYPKDLIAYARRGLALAEDPATSVAMGGRIRESVRYTVDPLTHLPRLRELLTSEMSSVLRAWYGTEFRVSSVRVWRIAHIPTEDQAFHHYGNLWHLDGHPVDVMKLFVQISDCAGPDGSADSALRFISRPDTRMALRRGYVDQQRVLPTARRFIEKRTVRFDEPPGSAIFLDTNRCLHRAGNPPPGMTRGMIQLMFLPASTAPLDGDYFAGIQQDLNVREGSIA